LSSCKIIGVGGAGCNLVAAICSAGHKSNLGQTVEYVLVDLGTQTMLPDQSICNAAESRSPITKIVLAPYGAGGRVNAARVAALRNIDVLKAAVSGLKTAIVVAGLGGGTGSAVTPILARLAGDAGAVTIAAVVMPFDFEGPRNGTANIALSYLEREVDLVMPFSNQDLGDAMGDGALLADIYAQQDQRITTWLQRLILG
jgi:cell division protein FtsZ